MIALPVTQGQNGNELSLLFARSPQFAIVDKANKSYQIIDNPFFTEQSGVGKKVVDFLVSQYKVKLLMGFELGLKVQQFAEESGLQLILIDEKQKKLNSILALMSIQEK